VYRASLAPRGAASAERALEVVLAERPAVRGEHVLDRKTEQRPETGDDLLARQYEPARFDVKPLAEIGKRVARDDRAMALDPEDHVVPLLSRVRLDAGGDEIEDLRRRIDRVEEE